MNFLFNNSSLLNKLISKFKPITSKCSRDNIFAIAGQSAFFIILSSVPLILFIVSMIQNIGISVDLFKDTLDDVFSTLFIEQISEYFDIAYKSAVKVSFISLIVMLWSASQGIHAITNGLNRVHHAYENRSWIARRLRAMLYTVILFCIVLVLLGGVVLGKSFNALVKPLLSSMPLALNIIFDLRYVIVFIVLTVLIALLYRNFPNISSDKRKEYGFKYQLPGAFLCTASWFVLSLGISIYVDNFNGFSVYGGISKIAVVMIWVYFCMICLMICAEINYVYHNKIKNIYKKRKLKIKK